MSEEPEPRPLKIDKDKLKKTREKLKRLLASKKKPEYHPPKGILTKENIQFLRELDEEDRIEIPEEGIELRVKIKDPVT